MGVVAIFGMTEIEEENRSGTGNDDEHKWVDGSTATATTLQINL